jgi:glycosyltransferase involved in cell wall biosynthesis
MKVFFVNTNRQWGGGEKWHFDTAEALMKSGYQVAVLSDSRYELFRRAASANLRTIAVRISNISFLNPFRLFQLAAVLRKEKPDVIILNYSADVKTAGISAALAGIHKIIYRRGNAKPIKNSILNRFLFKNIITDVIANSEETKKAILVNNNSLFPSQKIKVFYNWINLEEYDRLSAAGFYTRKHDEVVIGCAGRLSEEKGHRYLIEAASELTKTNDNFIVLIAGEGPEEASLRKMILEKRLDDHVKLSGFVSNIRSFMDSIDFFVLPSLWEGFGYVTIEAMAASKPVIAFNTGSNPEIIAEGGTGVLIDDFNIKALAESMRILIEDASMRERMGSEGRKRVENHFDMKAIRHQIEAFLFQK